MDLKPDLPLTFRVRSFGTTDGEETRDFRRHREGHGEVDHYAKDGYPRTVHSYKKSGSYIVTVDRTNAHGERAVGRPKMAIGSRL